MAGTAKYMAADTLGITLFGNAVGNFWGAERKTFQFGPWNLDVWVEARTDHMGDREGGLWCRITDRIWLYLWVAPDRTLIFVVDAKKLGLTADHYLDHCSLEPKMTVNTLLEKKVVTATFQYDPTDGKEGWLQVGAEAA